MRLKKFIILTLCLFFTLCLTGCGDGKEWWERKEDFTVIIEDDWSAQKRIEYNVAETLTEPFRLDYVYSEIGDRAVSPNIKCEYKGASFDTHYRITYEKKIGDSWETVSHILGKGQFYIVKSYYIYAKGKNDVNENEKLVAGIILDIYIN